MYIYIYIYGPPPLACCSAENPETAAIVVSNSSQMPRPFPLLLPSLLRFLSLLLLIVLDTDPSPGAWNLEGRWVFIIGGVQWEGGAVDGGGTV